MEHKTKGTEIHTAEMGRGTLREFLREQCRRRGWNLGDVARQAGLSRTTLYHLERGQIRRPRGKTLQKLAAALEITPEELWNCTRGEGRSSGRRPRFNRTASEGSSAEDDRQRRFDRVTNPAVAEVYGDSPGLFAGWSAEEWDELYSTFGTGGPLTREGVVDAAAKINRKRETVQQLHIILDTHLADVATQLVETLYRMARTPRASAILFEGRPETGRSTRSEQTAPVEKQNLDAHQDHE